jgi:hypothetical protein
VKQPSSVRKALRVTLAASCEERGPMNARTSVFVYAEDPVSQAGLEQLLRLR